MNALVWSAYETTLALPMARTVQKRLRPMDCASRCSDLPGASGGHIRELVVEGFSRAIGRAPILIADNAPKSAEVVIKRSEARSWKQLANERLDPFQVWKGTETMTTAEKSKAARKQLIDGLNEDLSRECQAIISYVNYSQVLKGAAHVNI